MWPSKKCRLRTSDPPAGTVGPGYPGTMMAGSSALANFTGADEHEIRICGRAASGGWLRLSLRHTHLLGIRQPMAANPADLPLTALVCSPDMRVSVCAAFIETCATATVLRARAHDWACRGGFARSKPVLSARGLTQTPASAEPRRSRVHECSPCKASLRCSLSTSASVSLTATSPAPGLWQG